MKENEEAFAGEVKKGNQDKQLLSFSASGLIFIAAWFGLLTGLIEGVFVVGWRQYYRETITHLSPHTLWMAPLSEMFIFIVLGGVLALLIWSFPRVFTLQLACFILAMLSFFALFLLFPQLNIYAKWILSIGLSVQTARIVGNHQNGFFHFVRFSFYFLIVIVCGLAIGTFSWEKLIERQALAKLPPPPTKTSPNVILITLDTVRAQNLSLYGYERKTSPQLEKFAQESVVFNQAIATASWTLPSHASIFTGRFPYEMSLGWTKPIKTSHQTLAEELGKRGYQTAGFVANLAYCTKTYGLNNGMIHYEDYPISLGQMILSSSLGQEISNAGFIRRVIGYHNNLNRKNAEVINKDFLDWLFSRDQNRPFFAFLNYFDAHEPLLPPIPFDGQFGNTNPKGNYIYQTTGVEFQNKHSWLEENAMKHLNAYDSSITYLDNRIGLLLNKLSEQGILDNTIVIITSDHGESLGEHGLYGHGYTLYLETLRVPLMIRYPTKVPKGMRIEQPVSLHELPTTVLDLISEENEKRSEENEKREDRKLFPGNSLGRYWDKTANESNTEITQIVFSEISKSDWMDSWYPSSRGDMKSLVKKGYHYIYNEDGTDELYNLETDPKELKNLAQTTEEQKTLEEFRIEMKKIFDVK